MGEIVISFIECILVFIYFSYVLIPDKEGVKRRIFGLFIMACLVASFNRIGIETAIKGILCMFMQAIYAITCFKGNRFEKVLFGISFSFIATAADQVTFRLADIMFGLDLELLLVPGIVRYGMMISYFAVCLICIMIIVSLRKNRLLLPTKYQFPLIVVVTGGIIAFDKLLDVVIAVQKTAMYDSIFKLTGFIYILLLSIFMAMIVIMTRLSHAYQETNELKEAMLQEKFSAEQYKTMKHSVETLSGWRHDMYNHLNTISSLIQHKQNTEALEFIDKTYGEMEKSTLIFQTGNVVLDAVISNKAMRARSDGIQFAFEIHIEIPIPLTPSECTSVFGNILDNAIDANNQITQGDKWIKMKINSHNRMIYVLLENSCDGKYEKEGEYYTSRKGGEHGIGLKQVERIVSKYGGFLRYMPENNVFKILISIPENQGKYK